MKRVPLIDIKDLNIIKGRTHIIKDFNLSINDGEIIALLGFNGAGKTTLVEAIGKVNTKIKGEIKYFDPAISDNIGFVFQDSFLPHGLTVKDIISMAAKTKKIKFYKNDLQKEKYEAKDNKKWKLVDLNSFLKEYNIENIYKFKGRNLSGGERQRVNIAISLMNQPKLLILDEITTGIDVVSKINIFKILKQKTKDSVIIFISHNNNDLETFCNRFIYLEKGQINEDLTKKDLFNKYKNLDEYMWEKGGDNV